MKTRKLVISGEINDKMLGNFIPMFKNFDEKPCNLQLIIASGGGDVSAGLGMYETIRTSNNPITTIGVGEVGSMAVLLFEAGDLRLATEGTIFLLHDGSVRVAANTLDAKSIVDEIHRNYNWYAEQIAQRCKVPVQKIKNLTKQESYMTAQQALNLKLVDEVIPYRKFARLVKKKSS